MLRNPFTIARASTKYNVSKSTLGDHISGKVKPGALSGPQRYLSQEEEKELVNFLLRCSSIGYTKTCKQVLSIVQRVITAKNIDRCVTDGWWASFHRRHPSLCLHTPTTLSKAHSTATDRGVFEKYVPACMTAESLRNESCFDDPVDFDNTSFSKCISLVNEPGSGYYYVLHLCLGSYRFCFKHIVVQYANLNTYYFTLDSLLSS